MRQGVHRADAQSRSRPAEDKKLAERITGSVRAIMEAKAKLRAPKLSDRESQALASEVEANENRINEAVFALYGVDGLPE